MSALVDKYSKEELEQIVSQSLSMKEVIDKLGYATHSGSNNNTVKDRLKKFNIDISHFTTSNPIERTEENVFCENSTASQATLRRWYLKGNYTNYKCSICGMEPIWQGKELTLILDHKNGENHDDRLENLRWVCPNCNQQLETTGYQAGLKESLTKKNYCIDCGKEISLAAKRCHECQSKTSSVKLEDMPITREELKTLIRTTPFTTIAKEFKVSDNAIRKWCDKFSLPRQKNVINSYSDKEWEEI